MRTAGLLRGKGDGTHGRKGSARASLISFPENRGTIGLRPPPAPLWVGDAKGSADSPEQEAGLLCGSGL